MKNYNEFINEKVSFNIDKVQKENFVEYDTNPEEWVESLKSYLRLKTGHVNFHTDIFEVDGIDENNNHVIIKQKGEYNSYGGPYTPVMELPIFTINDIDVYPLIKNDFLKNGYVKDNNEVDMTRTDLFNINELYRFVNMPEKERTNLLKSISIVKKFNL